MAKFNLLIKPYVIRVYIVSILAFVFVKGVIRPWVLENDFWIGFDVIVLSFPNFIEAIIGLSIVYGLILFAKHRRIFWLVEWSDRRLLFLSGALTSIYVLTQEYGLHNLGGNNVTDTFDAGASILGIILMMTVFSKIGFLKNN